MNRRRKDAEFEELVRQVRDSAAREAEALLRQAAQRLDRAASNWENVEKEVRDGSHRIGAGILGAALRTLGNGYERSVLPCDCGRGMKYVSDRERGVVTLLGEVRLRRAYYRCPCGDTRAPLDERLGIAGTKYSPGVRQAIGRLGAQRPFDHARDLLGELAGLWISQKTHRLVSERLGRTAPSREQPLVAVGRPVEDLYLLADGAMAPTRGGWREVKIGVAFAGGAGPDGKPRRQTTGYFADVLAAEDFGWRWYTLAERLGRDRARRLIVLGDGAAWIWNLAELHFPGAVQIVDWYHALERLWSVAHAVWGEENPAADRWMRPIRKWLANGQIERIRARLGALPARSKEARNAAREAAGYFKGNAERMRYRRFRRQGLFIGSGVVESGCKHIVGDRLKGAGMRWSLEGLRDILSLRLAVLYGPWPIRAKVPA